MKQWLLVLLGLSAADLQAQCAHKLLVSAYFSDNVHIYDGCTGAFLRNLDTPARLAGAQATRIGPDGLLYVVAEKRGFIVRYNPNTLEFVDDFLSVSAIIGATGMDFRDGSIWIGSYTGDRVRRYSLNTGQYLDAPVPEGAAGLDGPDNGMTFGPDGNLYVPGYDSHSVVRHNPTTGETSAFITAGSGTLFNARGIVFEPGGNSLLVSSEGNGKVLRFAASDGRFLGDVVTGLQRPTGLAFHPDGMLLVAHAAGVSRINAATGENLGIFATAASGQALGVTYVTVLSGDASSGVDDTQIGSQYWVTGAGPMQNNTIEIQDMVSTTGAAFGADFDPQDAVRKRWGSARIEFTSCTEGVFSWSSTGEGTAGFGNGSYPLTRLLHSAATERCLTAGFDNIADRDWIAGSWWGGEARNGEGLMLDLRDDDIAFLAWFTYRPR